MKANKHVLVLGLIISSVITLSAQTMVDAGPNQTIYCSGSVRLNAIPRNTWALYNPIQPIPTPLNSVCFQSPQIAVAVGGTSVVSIFPDGNVALGQMLGTGTLYSIYFVDNLKGFISGSNGSIYKTTDGGGNWTLMNSGTTNVLRSIFFTSSSTGYIAGFSGTIIKTTDGGSTWYPLTSGTSSNLYSVFFTTPETGYTAGATGTLLKTTDSGQTWTPVITNVTTTLNSIDFPTTTTGFIVGANGTILKTTDGTSWNLYSENKIYPELEDGNISTTYSRSLPTLFLNSVKFITPTTGYIGGSYTSSGIYLKTVDAGNTWFEQPLQKSARINAICFDSEKKVGYAVGSTGKVYKATTGEMKALVYNWSSPETLSNPNIANPVASPSHTTTYTVFAYDPNNPPNSFIDSVQVSVESLTLKMGNNKIIGCEGSVKLDSVITNYKGTEKLKYKWTPSTGLSNDTIPNPVVSVTANTTYYLTVTKSDNCSTNGQITVSMSPLIATATVDKTIVCNGTAQLSATTNYTGTSPLHYKWTPSTGLSNDTIANPTATVNTTTVYSVAVNSDSGCSATKNVTVTVNNMTANAGADKSVICGGSVQLDAVTSNYQESAMLRYKWTPAIGLNNDTIAAPIATVNSQTVYTVTVYSPNGCSATDNITINVTPLTLNAGADKSAYCGEPIQLNAPSSNYSGTGTLRYKWTPSIGLSNDTIANPVAAASNIIYTVTITTPSGCPASDNVAISVIPMDKPAINYVGINENNRNILVWTKPISEKIDSFNIYHETNVTNLFAKIGAVAYESASSFEDTSSKPDVQSNKYKISTLDMCGNETALSNQHKTMHLSINKGINTIWNLIWETYEGFPVSTYNIYRGPTKDNIKIIGSLSGSNTQFTDYTAPAGLVHYQIEAISSSGASSILQSKQNIRSEVDLTYSSRSNIATNNSDASGLNRLKDISGMIVMYPNPATNKILLTIQLKMN